MAADRSAAGKAVSNRLVVSLLLYLAPALALAADRELEPVDDSTCVTRSSVYRVSYTSDLDPIAINRIHDWVLHVETTQGEPVAGAEITVGGGMPAHDHGLPTSPRQTEELGNGDYLVEGMRFHMNGRWEIVVAVSANAGRDTCVLSLTL
jgi:hypothetical protein